MTPTSGTRARLRDGAVAEVLRQLAAGAGPDLSASTRTCSRSRRTASSASSRDLDHFHDLLEIRPYVNAWTSADDVHERSPIQT